MGNNGWSKRKIIRKDLIEGADDREFGGGA